MKRRISILLLLIVSLVLASCGYSRESAKDVMVREMEAIQSGDFEKIREYMNTDLLFSHPVSDGTLTPEGFDEEELALIFDNLRYKIVDVEENFFGATVKIEITNKDMNDVYKKYMDKYLPLILTEENFYLSAEEKDELSRDVLLEVLEDERDYLATTLQVSMYYVDEKWIIEASEEFNKAIMGASISNQE